MRLPIIQIASSIVSVIAGVLLSVAFFQSSLLMTSLLAAGGVLLFISAAVGAWFLVHGGFNSVVNQVKPVSYTHLTLPSKA